MQRVRPDTARHARSHCLACACATAAPLLHKAIAGLAYVAPFISSHELWLGSYKRSMMIRCSGLKQLDLEGGGNESSECYYLCMAFQADDLSVAFMPFFELLDVHLSTCKHELMLGPQNIVKYSFVGAGPT